MNALEKGLAQSMSYAEYRKMIDELRAENKTTGNDHSTEMLDYTDMNLTRMNKWDKRFEVSPETQEYLNNMEGQETWLVLTEAWCGDASHAVPVMNKIAEASPSVNLRLTLRDQNLDLMDQYLTNGGRSIPKLIRLKADTNEVLGTWGSRPQEAQDIFNKLKNEGLEKSEISKGVQLWFAKNRGKAIEAELMQGMMQPAG